MDVAVGSGRTSGLVARARGVAAHWLLRDVLLPFALVRGGLLWLVWWVRQYAPSWTYADPVAAARGWSYVPNLYLDVWGRYDTIWYLDLAQNGYVVRGPLETVQSNIAFFPVYPLLVRAAHELLPSAWQGTAALYLCAVAISNAAAIVALALLYVLVRDVWGDGAVARKTVLYTLLFPSGFFLSCAYSESIFLLLSVGAFLSGHRGRWWWAGAFAALAAATRATGIFLAPALAVTYMAQRSWSIRRVRLDAAALLLPAVALALHAANVARVSGDPLAVFHVQSAWHRHFAWPWRTVNVRGDRFMGQVDRFAMFGFIGLTTALTALRRLDWFVYAALSLGPILFSGVPMSAARLLVVVFPGFVALAQATRREGLHLVICLLLFGLQIAMFTSWARFYWAG
jgi:hypothetical protein